MQLPLFSELLYLHPVYTHWTNQSKVRIILYSLQYPTKNRCNVFASWIEYKLILNAKKKLDCEIAQHFSFLVIS